MLIPFNVNIQFQPIAINHSSDINFKDFMNLHIKCTAKPYSFIVNDTTLSSYYSYSFLLITLLIILTEKLEKYQNYPLEKLINMNILQVKKYYLLIKVE